MDINGRVLGIEMGVVDSMGRVVLLISDSLGSRTQEAKQALLLSMAPPRGRGRGRVKSGRGRGGGSVSRGRARSGGKSKEGELTVLLTVRMWTACGHSTSVYTMAAQGRMMWSSLPCDDVQ